MQELEQVGIRLTRCAGGHMGRGQVRSDSVRTGAERSGTTVKPFNEPAAQMAPALRGELLRGAVRRAIDPLDRSLCRLTVAALDRIADTLFARLLAFAPLQPNAAAPTWSQLALRNIIAQPRREL